MRVPTSKSISDHRCRSERSCATVGVVGGVDGDVGVGDVGELLAMGEPGVRKLPLSSCPSAVAVATATSAEVEAAELEAAELEAAELEAAKLEEAEVEAAVAAVWGWQ